VEKDDDERQRIEEEIRVKETYSGEEFRILPACAHSVSASSVSHTPPAVLIAPPIACLEVPGQVFIDLARPRSYL
jgi:hypothetical protein